jgi:hypothetical protein
VPDIRQKTNVPVAHKLPKQSVPEEFQPATSDSPHGMGSRLRNAAQTVPFTHSVEARLWMRGLGLSQRFVCEILRLSAKCRIARLSRCFNPHLLNRLPIFTQRTITCYTFSCGMFLTAMVTVKVVKQNDLNINRTKV